VELPLAELPAWRRAARVRRFAPQAWKVPAADRRPT